MQVIFIRKDSRLDRLRKTKGIPEVTDNEFWVKYRNDIKVENVYFEDDNYIKL